MFHHTMVHNAMGSVQRFIDRPFMGAKITSTMLDRWYANDAAPREYLPMAEIRQYNPCKHETTYTLCLENAEPISVCEQCHTEIAEDIRYGCRRPEWFPDENQFQPCGACAWCVPPDVEVPF